MDKQSTAERPLPQKRLASIDALRGFDMLWLIGGASVVGGLNAAFPNARTNWASHFFSEHTPWGFGTYYDLIFPLFTFIAGVVTPLALARRLERGDRSLAIHLQIVKRTVLLSLVGLIFVLGYLMDFRLAGIRWCGVLQRIGIGYMCASFLFLHTRWRTQAIIVGAILLGYWALLAWVHVPGFSPEQHYSFKDTLPFYYSPEGNLSFYIDKLLLPGRKICNFPETGGDNEGLLATIPYIAIAILGSLTGQWLQSKRSEKQKALAMFGAGLLSLGLGFAWGRVFPIIEILSTSSFVLVAVGWSLLLLASFYWIIDVKGYRAWAFFFIIIGMNAIAIYALGGMAIDFGATARFLTHGITNHLHDYHSTAPYLKQISFTQSVLIVNKDHRLDDQYQRLIFSLTMFSLKWLFCYFLYRQRIFIRL